MRTKHQLSSATQAEEVTNVAAMVATNALLTKEVATKEVVTNALLTKEVATKEVVTNEVVTKEVATVAADMIAAE